MLGWIRDRLARREPVLSEATAPDAAAIARLHAASFRRGWTDDEIESLLLDRSVLAHRAMAGKRMAGFIMSRMAAAEAEILSVAVADEYKGRGLSKAMLRLHLGRLAALGVRSVFLEADENNAPALRLYRRAGFAEVGRRRAYYPGVPAGTADALILRRDLV